MNLAEMLSMADKASEGVKVGSGNSFTPVKPGTYSVVVSQASGPNPSKRSNPANPNEFGQFLDIRFDITEGEFAGRKLFMRNNILVYPKTMTPDDQRKAQTAMAIGANERKILLSSIGKNAISSAEELVGATCSVVVSVSSDLNGNPRNEVKKLIATGSAPNSYAAHTPAHATQTQSAQKPKMPWEK